ncbi:DNA cytosine methyltransferase [Chitiniphilus purpureus]|uniref:DNA cytosine methyltransferase n=1 Tax=Chitiniphilus purpureus TaxID=2981137 RepID=UPI0038CBFEF5
MACANSPHHMSNSAYYNERDPFAAQWLRNLIAAGHIAPGDVDERSIEDVHPDDIRHYTQCHFFAGIGVWSYALRRAGWPDDRPVWTGSCPCQPFSAAGKGAGFADERHLWPAFHHLIKECRPAVIFGEQVARAPEWLALVHSDLGALGYAMGAMPIEAASAGAEGLRERFFFVADASSHGSDHPAIRRAVSQGQEPGRMPQPQRRFTQAIRCRDGKTRACEPGFVPWVDGSPAVLGRLRAYGNAINAEVARVFIEVAMECMP